VTRPVDTPFVPGAPRRPRTSAEGARYGVLRRLAPSLKHDMVVNLQAISMMAEVLGVRLERTPNIPAEFQDNIAKLNRLAREAVRNCIKVATWIEPGEDEAVRLTDGIDECVALLANNFSFRGFTLDKELADTDFRVWRAPLRCLLAGSLICLTDAALVPSEIRIRSAILNGMAELSIHVVPHPGLEAQPFEPAYRTLDWADVQSLADAEGITLVRGPDHLAMSLPRAVATAPLRIAPV
jgi:hypothetical protein